MAQSSVHTFYHVWFKWIDPLVLVPTVAMTIFKPEYLLDSLIPASMSPYNPDQAFLFHQIAALFAFVAVVQGGVLRVSDDVKVWRVIQAGILLIDVAMLASLYVSLEQQGRLGPGLRGGDWGNIAFTTLVTVIRSAFLANIGVSNGTGAIKRE